MSSLLAHAQVFMNHGMKCGAMLNTTQNQFTRSTIHFEKLRKHFTIEANQVMTREKVLAGRIRD